MSNPARAGLNAFFLLQERPEAYNLPPDPVVPTEHGKVAWRSAAAAMLAVGVGLVLLAVAGERDEPGHDPKEAATAARSRPTTGSRR